MTPKDCIIVRLQWWLEDISYKAPEQIDWHYAVAIENNFDHLSIDLMKDEEVRGAD